MITYQGEPVQVIAADLNDRYATVERPGGRVRCVSMLLLRGTQGGWLEVTRVCREAEKRMKASERTSV